MCIYLRFIIAVVSISAICSGCTSVAQKNLDENQFSLSSTEHGVIVGSVTAPFASHHHESVQFDYRKLGNDNENTGVFSSGMQHKNFLMKMPSCNEGGLPSQCGRLFAISLPAGNYEIYKASVVGRGDFQQMRPAVFTVTTGTVSYLGNLHVTYCEGMVTRYRGNILGADVSIRDEYKRDVALIREQFGPLHAVSVDKRLLTDHSWRWRVCWKALFRGDVEPYDWGGCSPSPVMAPNPTQ